MYVVHGRGSMWCEAARRLLHTLRFMARSQLPRRGFALLKHPFCLTSQVSRFPSEDEVVLPPGTELVVTKVVTERGGKVTVVHLSDVSAADRRALVT